MRRVTDLADYLGKKYGGWVPMAEAYGKGGDKWIAIPGRGATAATSTIASRR